MGGRGTWISLWCPKYFAHDCLSFHFKTCFLTNLTNSLLSVSEAWNFRFLMKKAPNKFSCGVCSQKSVITGQKRRLTPENSIFAIFRPIWPICKVRRAVDPKKLCHQAMAKDPNNFFMNQKWRLTGQNRRLTQKNCIFAIFRPKWPFFKVRTAVDPKNCTTKHWLWAQTTYPWNKSDG